MPEVTDPKLKQDLLFKSGLAIQLAAYEPDEAVFLSAHSDSDTVMVSRFPEETTVWHITSGTKEERRDLAHEIRRRICQ